MARADRIEGSVPVGGAKSAGRIKIDSNPKPLSEGQRLERSFNEWASRQPSAQKNGLKRTIKINTNPVPVTNKQPRVGGHAN